MEKLLDRLIQQWACRQRSQASSKKAQCGHHMIRRSNVLTRWNTKNIMPLTKKEHYDIHTNGLDYRTNEQKEYCTKMANASFKNYLIQNGLTEDEFYENKLRELYKKLNKEYSQATIDKIISGNIKKSVMSEYKKQLQKKIQEIWRKNQKEAYRKKKEYLMNLKKNS